MGSENNEFADLYERSFRTIETGTVVKGRVIALRPDTVVMDIGYKSEGVISLAEFTPAERDALKVGDEFEVYINQLRDQDGMVSLSRNRALRMQAAQHLQDAFRESQTVRGRVIERTKGGFTVDLDGTRAFLPGSQADIRPVKDPDGLIGREFDFRIVKLNPKMTNLIVSRRALIEAERAGLRAETVKHLTPGAHVKGVVKNITDYGVFVDLGGIDGLLHISDISWGRIAHPSEAFKPGDETEVVVLGFDPATDKVTLGYKQRTQDPWLTVQDRYPAGSSVRGTIVSIVDYGVFIEVEPGVEGLVHVSEMDWSPRPKHPSKYVKRGDTVEAKVLKVDGAERRLSLSLRQLLPRPWTLIAERYAVGQRISGRIKTVTDFGAFVGLPEGADALIHISDISWTRHIKHPSELLKKGQRIEAVVLHLDAGREKMALGIKQLTEDPWRHEIPEKYHSGDIVDCTVLRVTDYGIFVVINGEVEGLVYAAEAEPPKEGAEPFKAGDTLQARIIKIEPHERKIGLSMKQAAPAGTETPTA